MEKQNLVQTEAIRKNTTGYQTKQDSRIIKVKLEINEIKKKQTGERICKA